MRWSTALFHPDVERGDSHRPRVQSAMPTTRPSVVVVGAPPPHPDKPHANSRLCKSRISLCLCMGKLPILHAIAWLTEKAPPHVQRPGTCCRCQPYRSASASRNAPLCKSKSWSSTGMAVGHDDVLFSCRRSSLRELMFPEDRRASHSFSLRIAVCALFVRGAAGNAPSHCCMPSLIALVRVLATKFDVWCSCTLVVTGSQFSKATKPRRESEETSCIEWI